MFVFFPFVEVQHQPSLLAPCQTQQPEFHSVGWLSAGAVSQKAPLCGQNQSNSRCRCECKLSGCREPRLEDSLGHERQHGKDGCCKPQFITFFSQIPLSMFFFEDSPQNRKGSVHFAIPNFEVKWPNSFLAVICPEMPTPQRKLTDGLWFVGDN